jgi:hypothetical protein
LLGYQLSVTLRTDRSEDRLRFVFEFRIVTRNAIVAVVTDGLLHGGGQCKQCGRTLPRRVEGKRGRRRHYCDDACRVAAYRQQRALVCESRIGAWRCGWPRTGILTVPWSSSVVAGTRANSVYLCDFCRTMTLEWLNRQGIAGEGIIWKTLSSTGSSRHHSSDEVQMG